MNTIRLRQPVHSCLCEALRRFACFGCKDDGSRLNWTLTNVQEAWTGLGFQTEYKQAWEQGYMVPVHHITPRTMGWWRLTEKGAKIILDWHAQGFGPDLPDSYIMVDLPPYEVTA